MRAILASESSRDLSDARQVVQSHGIAATAEDCVAFENLELELSQSDQPDLVLVFVGSNVQAATSVIRTASRLVKVPVIAVGPYSDLNLVQEMQTEARVYLDQEHFRDQLGRVLDKLEREGAMAPQRGRIIVVTSATAGMGVTTVASGIAFGLGQRYPEKVLLSELGLSIPELALNLGIKGKHSLQDVLQHWEDLDETIIRQSVASVEGGAQVLAHPGGSLKPVIPSTEAMNTLIRLLPQLYDFVVLDMGHAFTRPAQEAIQRADTVMVVSRMEMPSLVLTRKYLKEMVRRDVPHEKLMVIANRTGQKKQLSREQAHQIVEISVEGWIPEDATSLIQSLNEGLPLVQIAPRAHITRSLSDLANQVNGKAP